MELAEILRKVEEAGKNNAVARSRFNDIYVWPVFRAQLISMFRNPELYFGNYPERKTERLTWKQKLLYRWYCFRFRRRFRRQVREVLDRLLWQFWERIERDVMKAEQARDAINTALQCAPRAARDRRERESGRDTRPRA